MGNAIILPSRLSTEAAAGEILVAQRTFAAIDGQVPAGPAGERKLKGFSRPMPVLSIDPRDGDGAAELETEAAS